ICARLFSPWVLYHNKYSSLFSIGAFPCQYFLFITQQTLFLPTPTRDHRQTSPLPRSPPSRAHPPHPPPPTPHPSPPPHPPRPPRNKRTDKAGILLLHRL